jgi:hypothetical protein
MIDVAYDKLPMIDIRAIFSVSSVYILFLIFDYVYSIRIRYMFDAYG